MLELKDIKKTYQSKRVEVEALKGITLTLPERGMVFIVGKSGSGKSTLLNILGGLDVPTATENRQKLLRRGITTVTVMNMSALYFRNTI